MLVLGCPCHVTLRSQLADVPACVRTLVTVRARVGNPSLCHDQPLEAMSAAKASECVEAGRDASSDCARNSASVLPVRMTTVVIRTMTVVSPVMSVEDMCLLPSLFGTPQSSRVVAYGLYTVVTLHVSILATCRPSLYVRRPSEMVALMCRGPSDFLKGKHPGDIGIHCQSPSLVSDSATNTPTIALPSHCELAYA